MSHKYMLYNLLLQGQLVSSSRCTTCDFIFKDTCTRRLDPLFPVDPPFSTKLNYTYLRENNLFSEIQLCGKRGVNREKGAPDTRI